MGVVIPFRPRRQQCDPLDPSTWETRRAHSTWWSTYIYACPHCTAAPGCWCRTATGARCSQPHAARIARTATHG